MDEGIDLLRLNHLSQLVGLPILFVAAPAGATLLALRITETTEENQLNWNPIDGNACNRPEEDPHQVEIWMITNMHEDNSPPRWGLINAGLILERQGPRGPRPDPSPQNHPQSPVNTRNEAQAPEGTQEDATGEDEDNFTQYWSGYGCSCGAGFPGFEQP